MIAASGMIGSLGLLGTAGATAVPAYDEALAIDFSEGYDLGTPSGQNGWSGANGFDYELVDNTDFPDAGLADGVSLRFSNTIASGVMSQLFSPRILDAGESTEATKNTFSASFTVSSTTGALQPGLNVEVAVDDNSATRSGGVVSLRHTDDALEIGTYWVPADAEGTLGFSDWRSKVVATVSADESHEITLVTTFKDGLEADTLDIYVDGVLEFTAGTYEFYHWHFNDLEKKQVANSILFRAGYRHPTESGIEFTPTNVTSLPSVDDEGFLFSDISYEVYNSALAPGAPPADDDLPAPTTGGFTPTGDTAQSGLGEVDNTKPFSGDLDWDDSADSFVDVFGYSTPIYLGTFPVVGGKVILTGVDLSALAAGGHRLVFVGQTSQTVQVVAITIAAAPAAVDTPAATHPATGSPELAPIATGALVVMLLGAFLALRASRRRA